MKKGISVILGTVTWTIFIAGVSADVPPLIPVQGILAESGGQALDGDYDLTFRIFETSSTTSHLWTETQQDVVVDRGFFSVYLGAETALTIDVLTSADELWLSMMVGAEELSRVQLGSVPYAFEAQVCRQVGELQEEDIQPMLGEACEDGTFLRGWDGDAGAPICETGCDCAAMEARLDAIELRLGCVGEGVIWDAANQLCWQHPKSASDMNWYHAVGEYHVDHNNSSVDYCGDLVLAGKDDWALPSRQNFVDFLDGCEANVLSGVQGYCYPCHTSPSCILLFYPDTESYWSSTAYNEGDSWRANIGTGSIWNNNKDSHLSVRCVRSGP